MIKEIIDYIGKTALRHKAVNRYKYQGRIMVNQQNDNAYMQFIIEDNHSLQYLKTASVHTLTMNIDIIGKPKDDTEILTVQDIAFQIGVEVIAYIERHAEKGLLSIWDYDFLALSHFTDDSSAGQRLTLELVVPNPINYCTLDDNFGEIKTDDETPDNELIIKPIRLK